MMGDSRVTRVKTSKLVRTDEDDLSEEPLRRLAGARGRTAVVALVLLAGVAAAVVFRKKEVETPPSPASSDAPLVLRENPPVAQPTPAPAPHLVGRIDPLDHRGLAPTPSRSELATPDASAAEMRDTPATTGREPPPLLSSSYPAPSEAAETPQSEGPSSLPRVHRVRDGDTLSGLARLYLGDGDLYLQIYEINRGVLKDGPDLLPIGAELKIPAADRVSPKSEDSWQPHSLVPIPEGALRRDDARDDASAERPRP
jgi:nucleoid-associated protein YgaU